MTKADLIRQISINTGFDKKAITVIVESFMEDVKASLSAGENVYLRGFGSFILKTRRAKVARNISKSTSVDVPEHNIPMFKAAAEFKDAVRNVAKKGK